MRLLAAGFLVLLCACGLAGQFDVGATGYKTQHSTAEVAATPAQTGCCPLGPYFPADVAVALSP